MNVRGLVHLRGYVQVNVWKPTILLAGSLLMLAGCGTVIHTTASAPTPDTSIAQPAVVYAPVQTVAPTPAPTVAPTPQAPPCPSGFHLINPDNSYSGCGRDEAPPCPSGMHNGTPGNSWSGCYPDPTPVPVPVPVPVCYVVVSEISNPAHIWQVSSTSEEECQTNADSANMTPNLQAVTTHTLASDAVYQCTTNDGAGNYVRVYNNGTADSRYAAQVYCNA